MGEEGFLQAYCEKARGGGASAQWRGVGWTGRHAAASLEEIGIQVSSTVKAVAQVAEV